MEILHRMPGQTFASGSESIGMIGFYDEDSDHVWFAGTGILRGVSIALANPIRLASLSILKNLCDQAPMLSRTDKFCGFAFSAV